MNNHTLTAFFLQVESFLASSVKNVGNMLDQNAILLKEVFQSFVQIQGLTFMIPQEYGGLGGDKAAWMDFNIKLAQYSGALLFLQGQHQFVIFVLKQYLPAKKVITLLENIVKTKEGIGLSFVAKKNAFTIKTNPEGLMLSGVLPWVSGFNFFSKILLIFNHNDKLYLTLLPFKAQKAEKGELTISACMNTTVFTSVNTVRIDLKNWFVHNDEIIVTCPLNDFKSIEHPTIYNFAGASTALLSLVKTSRHADNEKIKQILEILTLQLQEYLHNITIENTDKKILRAQGLTLAERCATFARIACGGEGMLTNHPLNRLSREIWQYAVSGLSDNQIEAYLNALTNDK
jgi:hypothetical protein